MKLLSKQGSRGCVYSHPHTAIAWVVLLFLSPPPQVFQGHCLPAPGCFSVPRGEVLARAPQLAALFTDKQRRVPFN